MDQHRADVVGGTLRESDPFLDAIHKRRTFPEATQEDLGGRVGNTANILYKRSVLEECLRHDGYVFRGPGEDIELVWRIRQKGAKILYAAVDVFHLRKFRPMAFLQHQFIRGLSVARLYQFYYAAQDSFISQPSLLWGQEETGHASNWWKVIWLKVIGPFDIRSFPSAVYFIMFWLGEKSQGLGFLWGLLQDKIQSGTYQQP
jgi:GT2 family glycosyltransferase